MDVKGKGGTWEINEIDRHALIKKEHQSSQSLSQLRFMSNPPKSN